MGREEHNLSRRGKIKRTIYFVLGTISFAIACIGVVLPLLPTTPFVLLAVACYLRSSKRTYNWLMNHKLFGQYIKNYFEGKGMSLRAKVISLAFLWTIMAYSALFVMPILIAQVILLIVALAVTLHLTILPTFKGQK
jgi:uncharacterized membrane protein YbaN (DUF454 family)